ncbi:hypothetical protein JXB12_01895 [candidate division KSB1 bacterium]|nr:hypothetical protein [candidate division KSB1 bacterium]
MNSDDKMTRMMIDDYSFGSMIVNDVCYKSDLILFESKIIGSWRRKEGHLLVVSDMIDHLTEFDPGILVIGTGKFGLMKVSNDVKTWCASKGICLVIKKTGTAWQTYNELTEDIGRVMGAFHLTC